MLWECGHDELLVEVNRFKGYRGVIQLRSLAPIADPRAESVAESALRLHWYDAGLPKPEPQWWVFDGFGVGLFRLDLALPEAFFACEYDGVEFHSSDEDRAADLDRRAWIESQRSWHIEVFTKEDVYALGADPTPRLRQRTGRRPDQARRAHVVPDLDPPGEPARASTGADVTGHRATGVQHVTGQRAWACNK